MYHRKIQLLFAVFAVIVSAFAFIQMPLLGIFALAGVLQAGLLGDVKNRIGNVVFAVWKGINYGRKYVVPENPNTPAQQAVRETFSLLQSIAQSLLPTLIPFAWNPFAVKMSGYNYWFKENYTVFSVGDVLTINNQMAKGTLEPTSALLNTYYTTGNGAFNCEWDSNIYGNGLTSDVCYIVVIDKSDNRILYSSSTGVTRNDGAFATTLLTGRTATNLIAWAFFFRGTGASFIVSDSLGVAVISG